MAATEAFVRNTQPCQVLKRGVLPKRPKPVATAPVIRAGWVSESSVDAMCARSRGLGKSAIAINACYQAAVPSKSGFLDQIARELFWQ